MGSIRGGLASRARSKSGVLGLALVMAQACGAQSPDRVANGSAGANGHAGGGGVLGASGGAVNSGTAGQASAGARSAAGAGGAMSETSSAGAGGVSAGAAGASANGGMSSNAGGVASSAGSSGAAGAGGGAPAITCDVTKYGAKNDGKTLNTRAIQAAIDACAAAGGGTVTVPNGNFLSGGLFLKPGVNFELQDGAVLAASKNIADFPIGPSRFEGHFEDRPASLLNGQKIDHVRITGPGTLDGNGAAYWAQDLPQGRPRLVFIRDSNDVTVSGVHFKNSPSWNLHLYNCQQVTVADSRFEIDAGADGPSTDGTDIDSCQHVTVSGCYYSVNDDCVVLKGNRYDGLTQTPASPPVSDVHVTNCTFVRGKGALSFGTEATYVHDVEFDHSSVQGDFPTLRLKMRPDTAGQRYENVNVHDIQVDGTDDLLAWELTHGTAVSGTPPPASIANVTVANITGQTAAFGNIAGNATTKVSGITLENTTLKLATPTLTATAVQGLTLSNVVVNGKQWSATANKGQPGPIQ